MCLGVVSAHEDRWPSRPMEGLRSLELRLQVTASCSAWELELNSGSLEEQQGLVHLSRPRIRIFESKNCYQIRKLGADLVSKMLAMQVWGPEFIPPEPPGSWG